MKFGSKRSQPKKNKKTIRTPASQSDLSDSIEKFVP